MQKAFVKDSVTVCAFSGVEEVKYRFRNRTTTNKQTKSSYDDEVMFFSALFACLGLIKHYGLSRRLQSGLH